jgi:hypothetical protein
MNYQIDTDGITVWVNANTGECIARFGRMGIDIHKLIEEQATGGQCLECTHGPVTIVDWERFKVAMVEHYGITVTDEYRPIRFNETVTI